MGGPAEAVFTLRKGMTKGRKGKLVASCSREWNSSMVTVEFWGTTGGSGVEFGASPSLSARKRRRTRRRQRRRTYHQGQDEAADAVPDLGGDVVAKLLQRGQETLQLAELASPAGGRQLLVGQRRGRGGGRPVAVPLRRGRHCVQGGRGVMIPVGHCGRKTSID